MDASLVVVVQAGEPGGQPLDGDLELGIEVDELLQARGNPGEGHLLAAATLLELLDAPVREVHAVHCPLSLRRLGTGRHSHGRVKTILPTRSPEAIRAKPSRACSRGSTESMTGRTPVSRQKLASRSSSSRVPIVEPTTRSWRKKIRLSSVADGFGPEVAPEMTTVPPGRSAR